MKKFFAIAALGWMVSGAATTAPAQLAVPPPAPAYQPLSAPQLDQLLGPIALYPDPLIAGILPASTFPAEIVMADRYVSGGGDPGLIDDQPWDPSVQALARYPQILQWMDQNLDWTTELGQAFLNQPQDVMDSIQRLRAEAENYGNLESTPQQQVIDDEGDIEILPVDPGTIYVPVYQPGEVYYQSGCSIAFGAGLPLGIWLNGDFDWQHHHLVQWTRDHPRPQDWWRERPDQRRADIDRDARAWNPAEHQNNAAPWGDRGWDNREPVPTSVRPEERPQSPTVTVIGRSANEPQHEATSGSRGGRPEEQQQQSPTVIRFGSSGNQPRPAAEPRPAAAPNRSEPEPAIRNPASNGAYIGIQSSEQTRSYSDRGRESMDTVNHQAPEQRSEPAPASHSSPPSGHAGGADGAHGGGSNRH